ncbi:chaperone NapD [Labilibaculum sp. DW002]|uniref:Chaperone NapD n=1 Tax=Paralabilibaculum antarcticum TaxID=2912572 RepID=A0ABT5VVM6_9BACT|nr:chaperone NapD [Labilibaculum sp. DW002]MDE5418364.1 chaperone NapD [Labilibaculum sp. DW002]
MNISSIVIRTLPEHSENLVSELKKSEICDYYLHDETKIIVTIEGEGISEEIAKLKKIQKMDHVISADMMYSYSEDELDREKDKIEKSDEIKPWLNDNSKDAGLISYAGDLKKKI